MVIVGQWDTATPRENSTHINFEFLQQSLVNCSQSTYFKVNFQSYSWKHLWKHHHNHRVGHNRRLCKFQFPLVSTDSLKSFRNDYLGYYRPQTRLQKGNVFTGACLLTGGGLNALRHGYIYLDTPGHEAWISPSLLQTWDLGTPPLWAWDLSTLLLVTSSGHHCTPVQTCSLDPQRDTWWPLKELRSGQAGSTHPTGMLSCL